MLLSGFPVYFSALTQKAFRKSIVDLFWGQILPGAVKVFRVVPIHESVSPTASIIQAHKSSFGIHCATFQRVKQGFRIGVVVAGMRTAV